MPDERKEDKEQAKQDSKIIDIIQVRHSLYSPDKKIISILKESVEEKKEKSETES